MSSDPPTLSELLSQALRGVRRARRLRAQDVAAAMGLPLRSYEYFEGGFGQVNLERVYAFAKATGSDGDAILAAILIGEPELAVWAADNKLVLALKIALGEFAEDLGADIARIDTQGPAHRLHPDVQRSRHRGEGQQSVGRVALGRCGRP